MEGVCRKGNSLEGEPIASLLECNKEEPCYVPNEVCASSRCVNPADTCPIHKSNPHKYVNRKCFLKYIYDAVIIYMYYYI